MTETRDSDRAQARAGAGRGTLSVDGTAGKQQACASCGYGADAHWGTSLDDALVAPGGRTFHFDNS